MSGLEAAAAVASIISGFGSAAALLAAWRARRNRRKRERLAGSSRAMQQPAGHLPDGPSDVEGELKQSGPMVQAEYDRDARRLGRRFAVGDDLGRLQLYECLVRLQQSIIDGFTSAVRRDDDIDLPGSRAAVLDVRRDSIRSLADQYQRMSVAQTTPGSDGLRPAVLEPEDMDLPADVKFCPGAKQKLITLAFKRNTLSFTTYKMVRCAATGCYYDGGHNTWARTDEYEAFGADLIPTATNRAGSTRVRFWQAQREFYTACHLHVSQALAYWIQLAPQLAQRAAWGPSRPQKPKGSVYYCSICFRKGTMSNRWLGMKGLRDHLHEVHAKEEDLRETPHIVMVTER